MSNFLGRGIGASPMTEAFPLSGQSATTPFILITGTTAAAQTTAHTADAFAYDMPYMRLDNVGASSVTVYGNIASTATTGNRQWAIAAGSFAIAYSFDVAVSGSGIIGFWATATSGIFVSGIISRTYTASG